MKLSWKVGFQFAVLPYMGFMLLVCTVESMVTIYIFSVVVIEQLNKHSQ